MTTPNEELITDLQQLANEIEISYRIESIEEAVKALQSQAERISGLEKEVAFQIKMKEQHCKRLSDERDTLRAQLAEIEKTEPVTHQFQTVDGGWHPFLDDRHFQNTKDDGRWPIRALFTRPMPAQDVTELVKDAERWRFTMWWQDQNPRPESIQNCLTDMHRWARARGALGPNSEELQRAVDAALSKYKGAK